MVCAGDIVRIHTVLNFFPHHRNYAALQKQQAEMERVKEAIEAEWKEVLDCVRNIPRTPVFFLAIKSILRNLFFLLRGMRF